MDFLKGEIKHINGYKFNKGEKIRFFRDPEDEDSVMIIGGRLIEPEEDSRKICPVKRTSFYDDVKFVDEEFTGEIEKMEKREKNRRCFDGFQDDWDD